MKSIRLTAALAVSALLSMGHGGTNAQQIYKWTDANGQVHYGQDKPDEAAQTRTLNIAPTSLAVPGAADANAAEIARLNALADQMARERQAAAQARQEQAIRNLEQENQRLKNDLLNEQLQREKQKQNDDNDNVVIRDPPPYYPYPYVYPPKSPYQPDAGPPCRPWPACRQSTPITPQPQPQPSKPLAKPNPPFKPESAGIASESQGIFRGR